MERHDKFERVQALIKRGYTINVDFALQGDRKTVTARLSKDCDIEDFMFTGKEVQRFVELLKSKVGNC